MLLCENGSGAYRLSQLPFAKKINTFVYSNAFVFLLALLTLVGNIFAIELVVYAFVALLVVYMCIFGRDLLPLLPLFIFCYIMPAVQNNPGKNAGSIFYMENGAWWFIVFAAMLIPALLFRLIADREIGFRNIARERPRLAIGMIILGGAYALSGIGSKGYGEIAGKNIVFALLQFISIFLPYFILCFTVKWREVDPRYCALVGLLMGLIVGVELLNVYRINNVLVEETFVRGNIYIGWGINNNMGVLLAMAIPFAFYFIRRGEYPVLCNLLAIGLCVFCVLSSSRAAILGAAGAYGMCLLLILLGETPRRIKLLTGACTALCLVTIVVAALASNSLQVTFMHGLESDSRVNLYSFGLEVFGKHPIFGSAFYLLNDFSDAIDPSWIWSDVAEFVDVFPGRWHNTFVQLLASCGLVGLLAYTYHRYQTVAVFVSRFNMEKLYIGASILVLLALSMLDCHFFNVGPVLVYSGFLAFAEKKTE